VRGTDAIRRDLRVKCDIKCCGNKGRVYLSAEFVVVIKKCVHIKKSEQAHSAVALPHDRSESKYCIVIVNSTGL
jgi:hypothetical protein